MPAGFRIVIFEKDWKMRKNSTFETVTMQRKPSFCVVGRDHSVYQFFCDNFFYSKKNEIKIESKLRKTLAA